MHTCILNLEDVTNCMSDNNFYIIIYILYLSLVGFLCYMEDMQQRKTTNTMSRVTVPLTLNLGTRWF